MTLVTVLVREAIDSGFFFTVPVYSASIPENIPNVTVVTVVNTIGHLLNEPLKYTLLNPGGRFVIRPTCGVVLTTGVPFDREEKESYELVVEVSREDEILRVARVTIQVQVCINIFLLCSKFHLILKLHVHLTEVLLSVQSFNLVSYHNVHFMKQCIHPLKLFCHQSFSLLSLYGPV